MSASGAGRLAFVGDVHLDETGPADVEAFLAFLRGLVDRGCRVVLIGDLFNLWVASPEFEGPHHRRVVEGLRDLRASGGRIRYVEGNRDFRVGHHAGGAFDDVTDRGIVEEIGGHRVYATHGDLANIRDRQYRIWRALSRSRLVWWLMSLVPRARRRRWAERMEDWMRGTNRRHKRVFPEAQVREYAAGFVRQGSDVVVLGHFHIEKEIPVEVAGRSARVFVLPEWKESRRHLELDEAGGLAFVDS